MIRERVQAAAGKRPFDVLIRHLKLVNVFDGSIAPGCLGLMNGFIAYAGPERPRTITTNDYLHKREE